MKKITWYKYINSIVELQLGIPDIAIPIMGSRIKKDNESYILSILLEYLIKNQ